MKLSGASGLLYSTHRRLMAMLEYNFKGWWKEDTTVLKKVGTFRVGSVGKNFSSSLFFQDFLLQAEQSLCLTVIMKIPSKRSRDKCTRVNLQWYNLKHGRKDIQEVERQVFLNMLLWHPSIYPSGEGPLSPFAELAPELAKLTLPTAAPFEALWLLFTSPFLTS